ncbi:MAG: zinc ribbon domain-containing protein [Chloroflexi bacterium]|nr:zinc ribbon domain-containing protein [Chloroflexota bacterium]
MPIYEYRCASCARDFELTRPVSQSGDPGACPTCGTPAEKLISAFASKADYTVKIPQKEPLRPPMPAAKAAATAAPKRKPPAKK